MRCINFKWKNSTVELFLTLDGGFYCLTKDDKRLTGMCCHPLIAAPCDDALAGEEECRSVFGTYRLSIPIDPTLDCSAQITYKNCKNLNVSLPNWLQSFDG